MINFNKIRDKFSKKKAENFENAFANNIEVSFGSSPIESGITFTNNKTNEKWTLSFEEKSNNARDFDTYLDNSYTYYTRLKNSKGDVVDTTSQSEAFYKKPIDDKNPENKYLYNGISYNKESPCAFFYEKANEVIKSYVDNMEKERMKNVKALANAKASDLNAVKKKVDEFLGR